jgi:tetratricopeptide (TPR) repeat protein/transglutaminase-like putative cysteine protease
LDLKRGQSLPLYCLLFSFLALHPALVESSDDVTKPTDYSAEPYVLERAVTKVTFENDGTSSQETTARIRIQSQAGLQQFGLLRFPYASATSTMDVVYVRVIKSGNRTVETPPENALDMPAEITRQAPFYSDLKEEQVAVKGLEIGDSLEYLYRAQVKKPLARGEFWFAFNFQRAGIVLDEGLQISVPRDRYVKVQSARVQPTTKDEGAYRIYSWKSSNLESASVKKAKPSKPDDPARLDVQISTFRDWNGVGEWFRSLAAPRAAPTAEIKAKADELTAGAKTDSEKIQAIYRFVSTKFRYIGVSLGIGRYQPHAAADVLTNDYGDCKDKHTLFAALLAAAGVKAYPALVNATTKIDPDVPSPSQFDHVITALPQEKGFLFLDTTPEVAPFGFLVKGVRDKEALVIPDVGPAKLIRTPAEPPFKSFYTFQADATLDDTGTLESKMQMSLRGDAELIYRLTFRQAGQPQWNDAMQRISSNLGFGGTVSDVTVTPPDETGAPFHVQYTYKRKTYGDWENRRILSPFPPILLPPLADDADENSQPIDLGSPGEASFEGTMKLPDHSNPHAPATVELHENFADYHSQYSVSDGVIHFERHLIVKAHEVPPAQFGAYRKFVKAIADDVTTFIPLSGESFASGETAGSSQARQLFEQGRQAWQERNMSRAADAMQRAVDMDPKFALAWMWLGGAHLELGNIDEGIEDMEKALELDPEQLPTYKSLASTFAVRQPGEDALKVWRGLKKTNPTDLDASRNIAAILLRENRYTEAANELEAARANAPNDSRILLLLGQTYIRAGSNEKGVVSIHKAIDASPTGSNLNSAAYSLAEANLQLDDALEYAEKAVDEIEESSDGISLDSLTLRDVQAMPSMAAYWDTLGWVHFRLGHLEKAEKYLNAAWALTQESVMADHLGQVYEKQGKKHEAAVAYSRALSAAGTPLNTQSRLSAIRPGAKYQAGEGPNPLALQELRTVRLGKLATKHASAEFYVLFAAGPKVVDVQFIKGSDELEDAGKAVAAAKFDVPFPDEAPTQILRRGILDCEPELPGCMFVLIPPNSVRSVK